jgi:hypothetical protein
VDFGEAEMILRITALKVCGPQLLELAFNNGVRKRVDVSPVLADPIFEPLRTSKGFAEARLDEECGTVVWPNGANLAREALFDLSGTTPKPNLKKHGAKQKAGT